MKAGNQSFILKTSSGQQIQLSRQAQLQLLQQQMSGNTTISQLIEGQQGTAVAQQAAPVLRQSVTPVGTSISLPFNSSQVTQQTISQIKSPSPAPNVNLVHLPPNLQLQHQTQPQSQQQFQIAPGTIIQLPSAGAGVTQALTNSTLLQGQIPGQTAIFGSSQQHTNLVNANSTVIQNPSIVNVNMGTQQPVLQQQRNNLGINIQGKKIFC